MNLNSLSNIANFISQLRKEEIWKNLQDKTQVFNDRVNDSVKSRGSHCEDVATISKILSRLMGGSELEQDRAFLIGLLHDLGHIPYGHAGEAVADNIIKNAELTEEEKKQILEVRKAIYGEKYVSSLSEKDSICFEHNENSVLQLMILCKKLGYEIDEEIITGIIAHSTSRYKELPETLSEQAVRLADKLAYINYDVDDLYQSFGVPGKESEFAALEKIYLEPLLDPDGNEITISINGKNYTIYDFVHLSAGERIEILVNASIEDALQQKNNPNNKYSGYDTILTGCNDIMVRMADLQKEKKKAKNSGNKELVQQKEAEILALKRDLYKRSPIMYLAYEIKDRSDMFIRSGKNLPKQDQIERTANAQSAVGNNDLLNEYIYKSIIQILQKEIENNKGLTKEQIFSKYKSSPTFLSFYFEYMKYRDMEMETIKLLPNNTTGAVYPEIYTIVNYIGTKSNSYLNLLAQKYGLIEKFNKEVLPKLRELREKEEYYDRDNGVLTKSGLELREKIVSEYGTSIVLDYSLEEEGISPTINDENLKLLLQSGYDVKESQLTKEEKEVAFREEAKKQENQLINNLKTMNINKEEILSENEGKRI